MEDLDCCCLLCLCRLLGKHEFSVVDEAVAVLVVSRQNGVDHVDKVVVLEDFGLRDGLTTAWIVVRLVCSCSPEKRENVASRAERFKTLTLLNATLPMTGAYVDYAAHFARSR